ncbi:MAG: carboxypeptidase-like regulatory domain-containing protein [Gemmatimonadales bacterium]|nr:MAG: carboxypeptidase-like regulatory domain-containing protein [Gemmatimonadales bacterium]
MLAHRIGLLVLFGLTSLGPSPEVVLTGRVTDRNAGTPIQGAQLSVEGEGLGALTDVNGVYSLSFGDGWAGRRVTIVVDQLGYTPTRQRVRLAEGSNTLDLTLASAALAMDALMVTASRVSKEALMSPSVAGALMFRQDLGGRFNPNFNTESYGLIERTLFPPFPSMWTGLRMRTSGDSSTMESAHPSTRFA